MNCDGCTAMGRRMDVMDGRMEGWMNAMDVPSCSGRSTIHHTRSTSAVHVLLHLQVSWIGSMGELREAFQSSVLYTYRVSSRVAPFVVGSWKAW